MIDEQTVSDVACIGNSVSRTLRCTGRQGARFCSFSYSAAPLLAIFFGGCGQDAPQQVGKPDASTEAADLQSSQSRRTAPPTADGKADANGEAKGERKGDAEADAATEAKGDDASPVTTTSAHRLALLSPGGPILCDLTISVDGSSSELALRLRSRRAFSANATSSSRIWQILDQDDSGELSASEIGHGPQSLWAYDGDDDRILYASELASLRERLEGGGAMSSPQTTEATRYAALLLESADDADRWDYLLSDLYAPRQSLGATSFSEIPELFVQLDADGDGALSTREISALATIAPHMRLQLGFHSSGEGDIPSSTLRLHELAGRIDVLDASVDRAVVRLGSTRLLWVVHEAPTSANDPSAAQPQSKDREPSEETAAQPIALQVHDDYDALFAEFDVDGDGRLGERETLQSPQRLVALDVNADGRLEPNEVPYWMAAVVSKGDAHAQTSFSVPQRLMASTSAKDQGWFAQADFNRDGDLSRREFLGSRDQFDQLDANGDGFIDAEESRQKAAAKAVPGIR